MYTVLKRVAKLGRRSQSWIILAASVAAYPPDFLFAQNALLITIDTLRADHLHCFGYSLTTSPQLDRLAADGYVFTSAYTPVPLTLPSHTAMMTGCYPAHNGVHDNGQPFVAAKSPTLAEIFRGRGYQTAAIVSTPILDHGFGLNRGFDYYNDRISRDQPGRLKRPADQAVDTAISWLGSRRRGPFFLWLHLYDIHRPYRIPPELRSKFSSPYDASIAFVDRELGRLFAYLRRTGLYDTMTVAVIADHGEGLGDHGEETHGLFIYDSTLHVPFILKPPRAKGGCFLPGAPIAEPVLTLDIYPTLLQLLLGINHTGQDGRSLVPLLCGIQGDSPRPLFAENQAPRLHFGWSQLYSVRVGDYKFIDAPHQELYDTVADPHENQNLADHNPPAARSLGLRLAGSYERDLTLHPAGSSSATNRRLEGLLEALGYTPALKISASNDPPARIDPKDRVEAMGLYLAATEAEARGQVLEAVALTRRALALAGESPPVHRLMGSLLLREAPDTAHLEAAAAQFAEVLRQSPDDPSSLQELASTEMRLGEFGSVCGLINRFISLHLPDSTLLVQLGDCQAHLGSWRSAARAYRRAIALNGGSVAAWRSYSILLLSMGEVSRSREALAHAIRIDRNDASLHRLMATIYGREGNVQLSRREEVRASNLLNGTSD